MEELEANPRPQGVEKLVANPLLWRVRVGDFRIIYTIAADEELIVVLVVGDRKNAYRDIRKLSPGGDQANRQFLYRPCVRR